MIVTFEHTYRSELLFLPARNGGGKLVGLEIIANFVCASDGNIRTPTELILPRLSDEQALTLFREKLALLESCQLFFIQQQQIAWINITPAITTAILSDNELAATVDRFPFIEFAVNENYPALNSGGDNESLARLAKRYPVVLANFGAGYASTKAIFNSLFYRVAMDKNFIHQRLTENSFEPFMRAIISQIEPYCSALMIAGIDDEHSLQRVMRFPFAAMQGAMWPAVDAAMLTSLIQQ
ncbi:EAL domain-containing protein (putative c-di-GMP-specific phosphodiesterase class I) [Enterobacter sp. BIGb0383]|uniref:EAL domain-containing protein n=1 Tax=unclassified Enterobacter TaxID=2608935 RepID=UPI000F495DA1|nr:MULTISPECIES: EAL domain-containing protein [unclassified Enterobacter]ROP62412.1 EAL domain-containing protein (putative c-di-GMP-specific phosphodiesterase class I) [Enterobacter sp. BIGb0383]ROS12572.1 EAL domain-containing protein (putative c-di-GMP-specific phosphodiesterase class I) [Enterobacter sp. BIGb0359]